MQLTLTPPLPIQACSRFVGGIAYCSSMDTSNADVSYTRESLRLTSFSWGTNVHTAQRLL